VTAIPTHPQLGAALRATAASARRLGDANNWRPVAGSDTASSWEAAAETQDPLQVTLTEADVQAVLLVRSALAHADEVGRAISSRQPFLPHSIGRITVEHSLRALHLAEQDAAPIQRAERRLDDLLYALTEGQRQRAAYTKKAKLDPSELPDTSHLRADIEARAAALGLTVVETRRELRVSTDGRKSTMALAETYLSGPYPGVAEFLIREHGAGIHGLETALLANSTDQFDPTTGINLPTPALPEPPVLAFTLLSVPLALDNAFRAVASRFEWPAAGKPWSTWDRDRNRLLQRWEDAIDAIDADTAGPAEMGLFGARVEG